VVLRTLGVDAYKLEWTPTKPGVGLTTALRKWTEADGTCFDPRTTPLQFSSGNLGDVYALGARVSNAPRSLVEILTSTSAFVIRPHPLEVLLGIKQAGGTDCHAIHDVLSIDHGSDDSTWKARWEELGTNETEARVELLIQLIRTVGPSLGNCGKSKLMGKLARIVGRSREWLVFWRRKSARVDDAWRVLISSRLARSHERPLVDLFTMCTVYHAVDLPRVYLKPRLGLTSRDGTSTHVHA
jgi:hypothetical protein